jgi:pyruvate kinase
MKKTKIVATIGPASSDKNILKQMFLEGLDVCRLNFSHGAYEQHTDAIKIIRELNKELKLNVAILVDLQGPKIRIDEVENNGITLIKDEVIIISTKKIVGTSKHISINYKDLPKDVLPGERILLDDGKLCIEILETNGNDTIKGKIVYGGILSSKKGVNLPNTKISLPLFVQLNLNKSWSFQKSFLLFCFKTTFSGMVSKN